MIIIRERYDNKKLISMYNKLEKQGHSPLWNDPYCQFVCKIGNDNFKFTFNPNTNKITKLNMNTGELKECK